MQIGIPKEIKDQEFRVGLTPGSVRVCCERGHQVFVERGAGVGAGFTDEDYTRAGATIVNSPADAWCRDWVVKVKESLCPYELRITNYELTGNSDLC